MLEHRSGTQFICELPEELGENVHLDPEYVRNLQDLSIYQLHRASLAADIARAREYRAWVLHVLRLVNQANEFGDFDIVAAGAELESALRAAHAAAQARVDAKAATIKEKRGNRVEQIRALRAAGLSWRAVSEEMNLSPVRCAGLLKRGERKDNVFSLRARKALWRLFPDNPGEHDILVDGDVAGYREKFKPILGARLFDLSNHASGKTLQEILNFFG